MDSGIGSRFNKTASVNPLSKLAWIIALSISIGFILVLPAMFYFRIQYPFELYWEEGLAVDHVLRVLGNQSIYTEPSLAFIPFVYTPFYFYLSALFSLIFGDGFFALRLVSIFSSIGIFLLLFILIKKKINILYAIIAMGFFAATYRMGGTFFDIGKPDMLFVFLSFAGFYCLVFSPSRINLILGPILMGLAFYTKQSSLFIIIPTAIYSIIANRKSGKQIALSFGIVLMGPYIVINLTTNGWFNFYCFELPALHPFRWQSIELFWTNNLLFPVPILLGLSFFSLLKINPNEERRRRTEYLVFGASFLFCSWMTAIHQGDSNIYIPAYLALALLATIGLYKFQLATEIVIGKNGSTLLASIIIIIQFGILVYSPQNQVPSVADRKAGEYFFTKLQDYPKPVWITHHGYYNYMTEGVVYATESSILSVLESNHPASGKLDSIIKTELVGGKFATIISDTDWLEMYIPKNYTREEIDWENATNFIPISGWATRPAYVYTQDVLKK